MRPGGWEGWGTLSMYGHKDEDSTPIEERNRLEGSMGASAYRSILTSLPRQGRSRRSVEAEILVVIARYVEMNTPQRHTLTKPNAASPEYFKGIYLQCWANLEIRTSRTILSSHVC